jgi:DNA-binding MarR family transcriptional regulator
VAKLFACGAVAELTGAGARVTVKDVAAGLQLEHSTVSRLLGELADEGLIERTADADDRRRTVVALTDLGRDVVADGRRISRFVMRSVMTDWSADDVTLLAGLLGRLAGDAEARLPGIPALARAEFCNDDSCH